jgi:hypothetical protein
MTVVNVPKGKKQEIKKMGLFDARIDKSNFPIEEIIDLNDKARKVPEYLKNIKDTLEE